jgi:hypothetical protein
MRSPTLWHAACRASSSRASALLVDQSAYVLQHITRLIEFQQSRTTRLLMRNLGSLRVRAGETAAPPGLHEWTPSSR